MPQPGWLAVAIAAGATYAGVGILFAIPTTHAQAWRLAAWGVSALVYGGHILHERFRFQSPPVRAAWHVAIGVAVGSLGLAVGANVHDMFVESTARQHQLLRLALLLWPLLTAVPAWFVALFGSVLLRAIAR